MPGVRKSDEARYLKALKRLFQSFFDALKKDPDAKVEDLLKEHTFELYQQAERVAKGMVTAQEQYSAKGWKDAAYKSTRGRAIYQQLKKDMKGPVGDRVRELIEENAQLIVTLSERWAKYAAEYSFRQAVMGKRPEQIEAEMRKRIPQHMQKNLKCIARTETSKAQAAITQARAENLGISAYIWHACGDERARFSHQSMDGILVFYNDPPSPERLFPQAGHPAYGQYHAGCTFNCRCHQEPVVEWEYLPDIIRVYSHGEIRAMTRTAIIHDFGR